MTILSLVKKIAKDHEAAFKAERVPKPREDIIQLAKLEDESLMIAEIQGLYPYEARSTTTRNFINILFQLSRLKLVQGNVVLGEKVTLSIEASKAEIRANFATSSAKKVISGVTSAVSSVSSALISVFVTSDSKATAELSPVFEEKGGVFEEIDKELNALKQKPGPDPKDIAQAHALAQALQSQDLRNKPFRESTFTRMINLEVELQNEYERFKAGIPELTKQFLKQFPEEKSQLELLKRRVEEKWKKYKNFFTSKIFPTAPFVTDTKTDSKESSPEDCASLAGTLAASYTKKSLPNMHDPDAAKTILHPQRAKNSVEQHAVELFTIIQTMKDSLKSEFKDCMQTDLILKTEWDELRRLEQLRIKDKNKEKKPAFIAAAEEPPVTASQSASVAPISVFKRGPQSEAYLSALGKEIFSDHPKIKRDQYSYF